MSLEQEYAVGQCTLCQRHLKRGTNEHHLIPRTCHRNRWFKKRFTREQMQQTIATCLDCHRAIHRLVPNEKELGRYYNSVSTLLAHPQIAKFVEWVSRQK